MTSQVLEKKLMLMKAHINNWQLQLHFFMYVIKNSVLCARPGQETVIRKIPGKVLYYNILTQSPKVVTTFFYLLFKDKIKVGILFFSCFLFSQGFHFLLQARTTVFYSIYLQRDLSVCPIPHPILSQVEKSIQNMAYLPTVFIGTISFCEIKKCDLSHCVSCDTEGGALKQSSCQQSKMMLHCLSHSNELGKYGGISSPPGFSLNTLIYEVKLFCLFLLPSFHTYKSILFNLECWFY